MNELCGKYVISLLWKHLISMLGSLCKRQVILQSMVWWKFKLTNLVSYKIRGRLWQGLRTTDVALTPVRAHLELLQSIKLHWERVVMTKKEGVGESPTVSMPNFDHWPHKDFKIFLARDIFLHCEWPAPERSRSGTCQYVKNSLPYFERTSKLQLMFSICFSSLLTTA